MVPNLLGPNYMVHMGVPTIKLKPSYNMGQIGLKRENCSYKIIFCPESNFNALGVDITIICLPSQKIGFVSGIFSKLQPILDFGTDFTCSTKKCP